LFLGLGLRLSPAPRKPSAEAPFEIFHEVGWTQEILLCPRFLQYQIMQAWNEKDRHREPIKD
jgi:hypothetical protein